MVHYTLKTVNYSEGETGIVYVHGFSTMSFIPVVTVTWLILSVYFSLCVHTCLHLMHSSVPINWHT